MHKTKVVKNICIQEKFIIRLIFYPGLALTAFRTTRPPLQVDLTWTLDPIKNQHLVDGQLQKIPDLDDDLLRRGRPRAMSLAMINMRKSIHGFPFFPIWVWGSSWKPKNQHLVSGQLQKNTWPRWWPPPSYAPTSNTASHDIHEKINSWVSFLSYVSMWLRLADLRAAGAPLWMRVQLGIYTKSNVWKFSQNCRNNSKEFLELSCWYSFIIGLRKLRTRAHCSGN